MDDFLDNDLGGPPEARRARRSRAGLPAGTSAAAMRVRGPPRGCCGEPERARQPAAGERARAHARRGRPRRPSRPASTCLCRARALTCQCAP